MPTVRASSGRSRSLSKTRYRSSPTAGTLTIRTSRADPAEAHALADLSRGRAYLKIEFSDSGPGIPADIKPRIFTPFFTSRARGLGLGLSIVKGILEAHRGGIVEVGEPGVGAHFVAFLPSNGA